MSILKLNLKRERKNKILLKEYYNFKIEFWNKDLQSYYQLKKNNKKSDS